MEKVNEKSVLQLLIGIFDITFNNNLKIEEKETKIKDIINNDMKDIKNIKFLSIQNYGGKDFDFFKSIKEDLKYLLLNDQKTFLLVNQRNNLIYLLCNILNSIIKSQEYKIEQKVIDAIYALITSSLFSDTEEHRQILISLLFQCAHQYPEKTQEILKNEKYSSTIIEQKQKTIKEARDLILSTLSFMKNDFIMNKKSKLVDLVDTNIKKYKTMNKMNQLEIIEEICSFIQTSQNHLRNQLRHFILNIFDMFPLTNLPVENLFFELREIVNIDYSEHRFYYDSCNVIYEEIKAILNQFSFRENVAKIFSSEIINDYYQMKNEYKDIQNKYVTTNSDNKTEYLLNIVSERIIQSYRNFSEQLLNEKFRNHFFDNCICVGRIKKSLKAFTNRYLQIIINYSGIDNLQFSFKRDLSELTISQEDKDIITKHVSGSLPEQYIEEELNFIQVLKSMLLLIIIHELNHYVRRYGNINEDITKCVTDRRIGEKNKYEGGEHMFEEIFGTKYFNKLTYKQAEIIYAPNNWRKENRETLLKLFSKNDAQGYVLQCMETYEKRGYCVEGYLD